MRCLLCGINTTEKKLSSFDLLTACAHLNTKKCIFRFEDYEEDESISSNNASSLSNACSNTKSVSIVSHSDNSADSSAVNTSVSCMSSEVSY